MFFKTLHDIFDNYVTKYKPNKNVNNYPKHCKIKTKMFQIIQKEI